MRKVRINSVTGDLLDQVDCEAIVNSAHPSMLAGSGVCGQIHNAAGRELETYCKRYAPLLTTQAVITPAFNLSNKYIIHVAAPKHYSSENPLLELCVTLINTMKLAERYGIKKIAIPAIGTGIHGYPIFDAISCYIASVKVLDSSTIIEEVRFVFMSLSAKKCFDRIYTSSLNANQ